MIKKGFTLLVAVSAFLYLFSCADGLDQEQEVDFYTTFDLWVAENYPELEKVEDTDGFYMRIIKNTDGNTEMPTDSDYVEISFSARTLDNRYAVNMDKERAYTLNSYSVNTHYVPFKFRLCYYYSYYGISYAQYLALQEMSIGDKVEIMVSPLYGYNYSATMYEGFGGDGSISSSSVYIEMELTNFSTDAESDAAAEVKAYATERGWEYVEKGVYVNRTLINDNEADSLRTDSTLTLNYKGYFTDGFMFDTNDEDVAIDEYRWSSSSTYTPLSFYYSPSDTTNVEGTIEAYKKVISTMKLGEKATFISIPEYCYGATGSYSTSGTLIYAHTPLIFDIEIIQDED